MEMSRKFYDGHVFGIRFDKLLPQFNPKTSKTGRVYIQWSAFNAYAEMKFEAQESKERANIVKEFEEDAEKFQAKYQGPKPFFWEKMLAKDMYKLVKTEQNAQVNPDQWQGWMVIDDRFLQWKIVNIEEHMARLRNRDPSLNDNLTPGNKEIFATYPIPFNDVRSIIDKTDKEIEDDIIILQDMHILFNHGHQELANEVLKGCFQE